MIILILLILFLWIIITILGWLLNKRIEEQLTIYEQNTIEQKSNENILIIYFVTEIVIFVWMICIFI
jgi:hypothetical protein